MSSVSTDSINQLFDLVDQDKDGVLSFPEVTALFHQLAPQQSAESAANAAVEALLLADRNTDTRLNRQEFAQMMTKVAELSGVPLDEAAQRLLEVTQQQQQQQQQQRVPPGPPASQPDATAPTTAAAAVAAAAEAGDTSPVTDTTAVAPAAGQLRALFELWDQQGDGHISFAELCHGLSKLRQPIKHKKDITCLIREAGGVLAAHDSDGDRQLDYQEFTSFLNQFMTAAGFALHEVLGDLITLTQTKPDSEKLQRVLDASQPHIEHMLSS